MPQPTNKLSQFWQELKRRKVIKVIAMYAATAFIIMEAGDIMLPRLGLPDWTVTFIIILLIVGFPIAIILSWIFDVTPEGIKKTGPVDVATEKESEIISVRRKLKASDLIIAVLLVIVVILAYPKIFKKDKLATLRDEDGRISIAVMPFQNMTNDTLWNIWQGGIQNELITNLSNSKELSVRQYQTMLSILQSTEHKNYASITPSVAGNLSRRLQANTFIQGSIKSAGAKIRINAHLIDAETEEIYKTFQIDGNTEEDILSITDSLSILVRNYLEIKKLQDGADYGIHILTPSYSVEAYRCFYQGYNFFMEADYSTALELFKRALEIDSNYISAWLMLPPTYHHLGMYEKEKLCLQELSEEKIQDLSYFEQLTLQIHKADYDKNPDEGLKTMRLALDLDPHIRVGWWQYGLYYTWIHQYEKAIPHFEKSLEINKQWGGGWKWPIAYTIPGNAYHELGNHKREKEIYELGLSVIPDQHRIIFLQAVCALSQGDTEEANDYIKKYSLVREAEGSEDYWIKYNIGRIYQQADQIDKAMDIFRDLIAEDPQEPWSKSQLGFILIDIEINIDEGMELIDQALEIAPDSWNILYTKGLGCYKQDKVKEAQEILTKAWDLRPRYSHEHYLLLQEVEQALASQNQ